MAKSLSPRLRSRLISIHQKIQQTGEDPLNSYRYTDDLVCNEMLALRSQGLIKAKDVHYQNGGVFAFVTITEAGRQIIA
jgi:hypothetical protein